MTRLLPLLPLLLVACTAPVEGQAPEPQTPAPVVVAASVETASTSANTATAPFDRHAAAAALVAVKIDDCLGKDSSPDDAGHVTVLFAVDGHASTLAVEGPFDADASRCIGEKFAAVSVPPFSGTPVRVGRAFLLKAGSNIASGRAAQKVIAKPAPL